MKTYFGNPFEKTIVNVYEKQTKKVVFTGSQSDAAVFIGTSPQNITNAVKFKSCIKNKYVVRNASAVKHITLIIMLIMFRL